MNSTQSIIIIIYCDLNRTLSFQHTHTHMLTARNAADIIGDISNFQNESLSYFSFRMKAVHCKF